MRLMGTAMACAMAAALLGSVAVPGGAAAQEGSGAADLLLVVNKSGHTLSFVEAATGRELATVPTGFAPHEVAVSADGRYAYVTDYGTGPRPGNTITVVDIPARQVVRTLDLGRHTRPHGIEVAPDGSLWVTTEGSAHVVRVDPGSGEIVTEAETGERVTHMVKLAPGHGRVYTANIGSGTVSAVDMGTGQVLEHIATGAGAEGLALSPDGSRLYVTNREAGTLTEIDPATDGIVRTLAVGEFPIRVEVTPDGRRALVSNARADELAVIDLAAWEVEHRIPVGAMPVGIEIAPDGRTAWVANTMADRISVVDLEEWRVTDTIEAGAEPDGMAWVEGAR